jgi:hypothetical protein
MTDVLRREPSLRAAGGLRVVRARALAEAPGRRRIVRYEVAGLDAERTVRLVGKVYAGRVTSSIAHRNLRLLGDTVFAATPRTGVPRVVCHVPALRTVLYREVTGTPLDRLPPEDGVRVAGLAAEWLAELHGSDAVLVRRSDLAHELDDVRLWADVVGAAAPGVRSAARELAERVCTAAADLPAVREVPIHKDLHAGHVIAVRGGPAGGRGDAAGRVVVIDLDEARMGDPAADVASFTTYLDVSPDPGAREVRDAFLAGYGPLPGPSPELRTAFFAACTCVKIAKQLVAERGPVAVPSGAARTAALQAVLRRGSACLAG